MNQVPPAFKDIRPYTDDEVTGIISELLSNAEFEKVLKTAFPHKESEMRAILSKVDSIRRFQVEFIYPLLLQIEAQSTDGLFFEGWEQLEADTAYLFISNHRDIFLDAGLFSGLLHRQGFETAANAIGDNLLAHPIAERLGKLNKSFVVKRSLPVRELLAYTQLLSRYIQFCLHEQQTSIWIAQRSGRTKDGNDKTLTALLKMLSGKLASSDFVAYFKSLRIVPLAISYEFEPCAAAKARESVLRVQGKDYEKQPWEDLLQIQQGIEQAKGRVCFRLAPQLQAAELDTLEALPRNEAYQGLARLIDKAIHQNYQLYSSNYIAADRLAARSRFSKHYNAQEEQRFDAHLAAEMTGMEDVPKAALEQQLLRIYAQPLWNQMGKE